jgi:hypothetical protein
MGFSKPEFQTFLQPRQSYSSILPHPQGHYGQLEMKKTGPLATPGTYKQMLRMASLGMETLLRSKNPSGINTTGGMLMPTLLAF